MYRVILADDETILRENMSRRIQWEKYGFELVCSCKNGKEVLDYLEKGEADLVISDICMPYMDGMELCERLHKEHPRVKVMLLSGYEEFEYAKKAIRYGVLEYILKPVTASEMGEQLKKIAQVLEQERKEREDLGRYREIYRDNFMRISSGRLMDFITGESDRGECAKELERMEIALPVLGFRTAVVESGLFSSQNRDSSLIAFAVFNIVQQVVNEQYAGCVCLGQNNRTVILFEDDGTEKMYGHIREICGEILKLIGTYTGLKPVIGLGSYTKDWEGLGRSYENAKDAVSYRYLFGTGCIIDMECRREANINECVREDLDHLQESVKQADEQRAELAVTQLKVHMREGWLTSSQCGAALCHGVDMLRRLRPESELQKRERNTATASEEILAASTLDEAAAVLKRYAGGCIEELRAGMQSSSGRYAQKALHFIEKNYADPGLGIREVCSHLGLSASYFSGIMKSETGETFVEILNRIRIQHARELLEHTDLKAYEVAQRVGFADAHYFGIAFKKATGMSPSAYVRKYIQKNSARMHGQEMQ